MTPVLFHWHPDVLTGNGPEYQVNASSLCKTLSRWICLLGIAAKVTVRTRINLPPTSTLGNDPQLSLQVVMSAIHPHIFVSCSTAHSSARTNRHFDVLLSNLYRVDTKQFRKTISNAQMVA